MDGEAFAPDLAYDRRGPGGPLGLRKRQPVVLAVLHSTSHASRPYPIASLRTSGNPFCSTDVDFLRIPFMTRKAIGFVWAPNERTAPQLTRQRQQKHPFSFRSGTIYEFVWGGARSIRTLSLLFNGHSTLRSA